MPTWLGDQAAPPDHHVVRNLHQIVYFRTFADHGITQRTAINCGVGPDLHVVLDDDPPDLRDLGVPVSSRQEAIAVLADPAARMHDHSVAEQAAGDRCAGADGAAPADRDMRPDHGARADDAARPYLDVRTDDGMGLDADVVLKLAVGWTTAAGEMPAIPACNGGLSASACSLRATATNAR